MEQELKQYLDGKFVELNSKVTEVASHFVELNSKVTEVASKFVEMKMEMNSRFAAMDSKFAAMDSTFATKQDLERVETALLTEFHKWASPFEARARTHTATLRAIDLEMEALTERVQKLERPE